MAEEKTTTTKRGRKPKTENQEVETVNVVENTKVVEENTKNEPSIADLMETIVNLQKQTEELRKKAEEKENENVKLSDLVEAFKNSNGTPRKELPKRIQVVSLIPNKMSLTTKPDGMGTIYSFAKYGSLVSIKTTDLEDILSVQKYRDQAKKGYFYICNEDFVEEQELTEDYKEINNKEMLDHIMSLSEDSCVDMFCSLHEDLREALSTKMAEEIVEGKMFDRNRLAEISFRTQIDIEKQAEALKEIKDKINK